MVKNGNFAHLWFLDTNDWDALIGAAIFQSVPFSFQSSGVKNVVIGMSLFFGVFWFFCFVFLGGGGSVTIPDLAMVSSYFSVLRWFHDMGH